VIDMSTSRKVQPMSHFAKHMKRLTGPFNLEQSKNGALLIGFCESKNDK